MSLFKLFQIAFIVAVLAAPFTDGLRQGLTFYLYTSGLILCLIVAAILFTKIRNYKKSGIVCPTIEWLDSANKPEG